MPVYEYLCRDCGKVTEIRATLKEKEKGIQPTCPSCQSNNMAHYFGNMQVVSNYPLH